LLERLMDWRGLLQRQTAEARQILRKLLVRRLVFTPREDEEGKYYEFAGKGAISEVITGVVLPKVWWPQRDPHALGWRFLCEDRAGRGQPKPQQPTLRPPTVVSVAVRSIRDGPGLRPAKGPWQNCQNRPSYCLADRGNVAGEPPADAQTRRK